MASVGIHFSYKKEMRRACLYCIAIMVISFLLITIKLATQTLFNHQIYVIYSVQKLAGLYYLCLNLCRLFLPLSPSIAFIFLLHSLRMRLIALNSFLRFIHISVSSVKISILEILFLGFFSLLLEILFSMEINQQKIFAQKIQFVS